jgi:PKHD-type hydroxylase
MMMHDPRKIRERLGVNSNVLLSPKRPQPKIHEDSVQDCLTHEGIFSTEECARAISDNAPLEWDEAGMTKDQAAKRINHDYRHTHNAWIQREEKNLWLFDKMLALVVSANQHKYQFEVDFFEAIQLAKYDEGMHYDWHTDLGPGNAGNRKISVTVQLSLPEDYEGGDLLLDIGAEEPFTAPREVGSVTVFPSFMRHKVAPVTKGTRFSLVVWASGTHRFR